MKGKQPTLLNLCVEDTQAKQWWSLAPQQSDIAGVQVQLEDRGIHVLRPKDEITMMRDSEWMVQLFSTVHHLQHEANIQCNHKIWRAKERHGNHTDMIITPVPDGNYKCGAQLHKLGSTT